jgi:hypothetical protein
MGMSSNAKKTIEAKSFAPEFLKRDSEGRQI